MARPEYVKCVRDGVYESTTSFCGRETSGGFAFTDATHAVLNARNEGRLLICPECAKAMLEAIQSGTYLDPSVE